MITLESPPPGFTVTKEWQAMPPEIRTWARFLWIEMAARPTTDRVPFTCGDKSGILRKSWGKGESKGQFIFMALKHCTVVFNYKTKQAKLL